MQLNEMHANGIHNSNNHCESEIWLKQAQYSLHLWPCPQRHTPDIGKCAGFRHGCQRAFHHREAHCSSNLISCLCFQLDTGASSHLEHSSYSGPSACGLCAFCKLSGRCNHHNLSHGSLCQQSTHSMLKADMSISATPDPGGQPQARMPGMCIWSSVLDLHHGLLCVPCSCSSQQLKPNLGEAPLPRLDFSKCSSPAMRIS